jgi:hypothetical protein
VANNNQIYKMSNAGGFKSLNRYHDMLAGNTVWNPWEPDGAYDALATVTVPSGGLATITFAGIPNTYKHLQIRASVLTATGGKLIVLTCNNDTTAGNYVSHILSGPGSGSGVAAAFTSSQTNMRIYGRDVGTSTTQPTALITDVLDYQSTNKNKTTRTLSGLDQNGSGEINFYSGLWLNSASAVTSLELKTNDSTNFAQHSQFTLYGIR